MVSLNPLGISETGSDLKITWDYLEDKAWEPTPRPSSSLFFADIIIFIFVFFLQTV